MSLANPQALTFCPTCESDLPPGTKLYYFAQSPLCPEKHDLDFGNEVLFMLEDMKALFEAIGYSENFTLETAQQLGKLGCHVADEAQRRWQLFDGDVQALNERADKAAALVAQLAGSEG